MTICSIDLVPCRNENLNPSLMKLKLLEVLRNADINKLKYLISQIDNNPTNYDLQRLKDEILLFAVQVAPFSIIQFLVDNGLVEDINSQDNDGNTALHLAANSNRNDVIKYLMSQPSINDCLYNKESKQPIQCTTNIETAQLMDNLRSQHIERIASQLRYGFETRNFELLEQLLTNPRDKELLDINGTDPVTNDTVLIEFIKKGDKEMVKFILNHGGDPFKRSLSGKLPEEYTLDPEMKKIIEDSFNNQNIMETTAHPQDGSPTYKGFLKKWTNFAGGYKLRWFVLDHHAVLSYYKSPNDMNNTCRGLIHLAHAMLRVNSSENTKFEIIIQNPSDGSPVRWHLMANHATEAQKWIWVLQNAIRYAKDVEKGNGTTAKSHILNEDLPASTSLFQDSNQPFSSMYHPAPIPETKVLSNEAIEKESEGRKTVSSIISDAHEAANDFKELVKATDSETELPLQMSNHEDEEAQDNDTHELENSTNISDSNSSRTHGPAPDRSSMYSSSKQDSIASHDGLHRHQRTGSINSLNSANSERSSSKSSLAKSLYKKPFKKLSHIGKKTRQSFLPPETHKYQQRNLEAVDSVSSFISDKSSIVSTPDIEETGQFAESNSNNDDDESESIAKELHNADLNVVRNQMTMQLNTFKDFLNAARTDPGIGKDDLVDMSVSILNTLNMLINQEGQCVNHKYNELIRRLEKQQKISSIWENSIKQLEIEIQDRETKIVELEDKLKAVKKSLRNSVLHGSQLVKKGIPDVPQEREQASNPSSAAALARKALTANLNTTSAIPPIPSSSPPIDYIKQQQEEERALRHQNEIKSKFLSSEADTSHVSVSSVPPDFAPPPVPSFDPTLTEFLEESDDSDEEFFDAEDDGHVQDMGVLVRRETIKASKKKAINPSPNTNEEYLASTTQQPTFPNTTQLSNATYQNVYEPEDEVSSIQESNENEPGESRNPEKLEQNGEARPEQSLNTQAESHAITEAKFQPKIDEHGHFVVNHHELKSKPQNERFKMILKDHTFEGYEDPLRLSLAPQDTRPKISLWGVLKSLVGKDMTKMTLPVTFNEPTSLLQRNVEVIEYSDLLDKASAIDDSTLRLVYVATFAASEYASTVGRIAKPFNPLLGETFEYARPDKGYRCFAEQVSHHPPISALVAESPSWSYYGESNVKTKFLGRSFDIKHLGTWYCEIYPDNGVQCKDGSQTDMELYSWKKVNNSVIGIIVGNPTIDNYGTMEIRNHMTGDHMKFEFKPRGWRASSAYEVKGEVFNAKGKLMYYLGGHWNSKIYCRPADDKKAEKFLVWEAAPRKEMMFHLTSFAATLNAPQKHLLPKVACTDTRLRPDQRAMENGEYDKASEEKNRVEEKQRAARMQREMKGEVYKPFFFRKAKHPITGEEFWEYEGKYWEERMEGKLKNYKDIF